MTWGTMERRGMKGEDVEDGEEVVAVAGEAATRVFCTRGRLACRSANKGSHRTTPTKPPAPACDGPSPTPATKGTHALVVKTTACKLELVLNICGISRESPRDG